eukprot:gene7874-9244_t
MYIDVNFKKNGQRLYLNVRKVLLPRETASSSPRNEDQPPVKKLAIGMEGGFNDDEQPTYEDKRALYVHPEGVYIALDDPNIPPTIANAVSELIRLNSQSRKEEIVGWSAETVVPSKHASNLLQLDNGAKIPPSGWRCSVANCDKTENLWLNLTDGFIGCGRKYADGSGGNGHAQAHYDETQYPLSVKLGTITKEGTADVYSYPEGDMVADPELKQHLAHFGINIFDMRKTEKSMAELELDQNLNFEFGKIKEKGRDLKNAFGPGLTGIENLGNTCYMSSVLQMLFSTPHFQRRYLETRAKSFAEITQDPSQSFEIQMSKLADGLLSGDYSTPDSANKPKTEQEFEKASQVGIAPKMFKSLVGGSHPLFSTFQQQDALEYFQYIMQLVEREEKKRPSWVKEEDPNKAFNFIVEDRIECGSSGKVKYTRRTDNVLSLPIPLEATTNKDAVELYEQTVALNGGKKDPLIDEVRPIVPLQACLQAFAESYQVADFFSTAVNKKTYSINSTKLASFPDILVIHLRKYVISSDWTPKKLNVYIDAPDILDLEDLRGYGKKDMEEDLPEEVAGGAPTIAAAQQPNQEVVDQLVAIGFPLVRCQKAALATGNNNPEEAMNWLLEHGEDAGIDDPIPQPVAAAAASTPSSTNFNADDVAMLEGMGFTSKQAKLALSKTSNNMERAADWLFNHMDDLDLLVAQSESESSSTPSSSAAAATTSSSSSNQHLLAKVHDGPAILRATLGMHISVQQQALLEVLQ